MANSAQIDTPLACTMRFQQHRALMMGVISLDRKYDAMARRLGDLFWLPVSHAYLAFCYAYSRIAL